MPGQDDLIGRVIVEHARAGRASYLIGKSDGGAFSISEVREKKLSVEEFPGFNSVCVSFSKLKLIIEQQIQSWYGALSNIKGVYLITDRETGKLYVGSATGDCGLWQRWSSYVTSGHGGNKELIALLKNKPIDYCSRFQYSILEIADSHASDGYIGKREIYWKDVLMSRVHGYNSN
ncbi:GIY-YIG nuclease family protein [Chitinivorax sp. PXF-14]|uniref:GIY-YIG nuclease family protein n=1 Tax=Chitinivorax sp. PXF-14 TaxID=3230488 RepID=UPI003467258E